MGQADSVQDATACSPPVSRQRGVKDDAAQPPRAGFAIRALPVRDSFFERHRGVVALVPLEDQLVALERHVAALLWVERRGGVVQGGLVGAGHEQGLRLALEGHRLHRGAVGGHEPARVAHDSAQQLPERHGPWVAAHGLRELGLRERQDLGRARRRPRRVLGGQRRRGRGSDALREGQLLGERLGAQLRDGAGGGEEPAAADAAQQASGGVRAPQWRQQALRHHRQVAVGWHWLAG